MMKNTLTLVALLAVFTACSEKPKQENTTDTADSVQTVVTDPIEEKIKTLPKPLAQGIAAHGGLEKWNNFRTLSYTLGNSEEDTLKERQHIDLHNRKVLIEGKGYNIGFDGTQVWVSPSKADFAGPSARFYHNLVFYFFGIPFLLADDGAIYEELGEQTVNDKTYNAVKVTYASGTGDAPDDAYIAHFDMETNELSLLLYTVTYFNGGKKDAPASYNAMFYEDWKNINGLKVPTRLKGYKYADGKTTELRYTKLFSDIEFSEEALSESTFAMPEVAEVDSLPQP